MADYIIQKAVNLDAVKKKLQRPLAELQLTYEAQRKYDGCCAVMGFPLVGGSWTKSRTGETNFALAQIERQLEAACRGYVLIGEAWHCDIPFNEISGHFRRYQENDDLNLIVNDVLTITEFEAGYSAVPYAARKQRWTDLAPHIDRAWFAASYAPGTYDAQALCNELVDDPAGYDGLVLRDLLGTWTVGSGTTGEILKVKRVLSFDLLITGFKMGEGKHAGRLGALSFDFKGKTLWVGTGFSDRERDLWWHYGTAFPSGKLAILGRIGEVEAMDYSSDGLLREPRFKGLRHDKINADF